MKKLLSEHALHSGGGAANEVAEVENTAAAAAAEKKRADEAAAAEKAATGDGADTKVVGAEVEKAVAGAPDSGAAAVSREPPRYCKKCQEVFRAPTCNGGHAVFM